MSYKIVRFYQRSEEGRELVRKGLTLEEARAHCKDPETSWRTCQRQAGLDRTKYRGAWFDGYEKNK